jgi:hypothetical protein
LGETAAAKLKASGADAYFIELDFLADSFVSPGNQDDLFLVTLRHRKPLSD